MNYRSMDKLSLDLQVIDGNLACFLEVNGVQVLDEYSTDVSAFFAHFKIDANLQKKPLGRSYFIASDFFPLSCSCGIAGCNGFHDGIYQKNKKYSVEWRVDPEYYASHLSKRYYCFPVTNYRYEVLKSWFWIIDGLVDPVNMGTGATDALRGVLEKIEGFYPVQYAQLMSSRKEYEHYKKVNALFSELPRTRKN